MNLDFTAIDFETASSQPGSVCAVGMVRVRDGQVAGKSGGLVRPPDGLGEFAGYQTSVHGVTAEMVILLTELTGASGAFGTTG